MDFVLEAERRFRLQGEYLGNNKPVNNIAPVVSVTVATYQHAKYIRDCLDGILMQRTDFPIEIIVGEDGSVDGTREICVRYATDHQDKIRLFLRDRAVTHCQLENRSFRFNGIFNRMSAMGKYIAWCDGDDYWIDPYKLQKQVDFLEANPDHGLVFTDSDFYYGENGRRICAYDRTFRTHVPSGDVLDSLLYENHYRTCTSLFRKELMDGIDQLLLRRRFKMGDYPLWLLIAGKAKVGYIPESTAVYRLRKESASHFDTLENLRLFIRSSYQVSIYFASHYRRPIDRNKLKEIYRRELLRFCIRRRQYQILFNNAKFFTWAVPIITKGLVRKLRGLRLLRYS